MNAEIEDLRRQLGDYQLPTQYDVHDDGSSSAAMETGALLAQYKKARDEYLQRKMLHAVIHHAATTYDAASGTFVMLPPVPTQEEHEALEERRNEVLQTLTQKAASVQRTVLELQAKHAHFQQRREEFEELVLLQQEQEENDDEDQIGEDEEDITIDEAEMAAQEEKLAALQKRRAALEVQLRSVQQQNMKASKEVEQRNSELQGLLIVGDENENQQPASQNLNVTNLVNDPAALQNLKSTTAELQAKLAKLTEISSFYENLRLLMEELGGIRILSVVQQPDNSSNCCISMLLTVQLLHKYNVEIALQMTGNKNKDFVIQSAQFVSSVNGNNDAVVVTGPAINEDDEDEEGSVVQLRIPELDDLVQLAAASAATMSAGENLRFVLRESLARAYMVEERVMELTVLQQMPGVVTKIGTFSNGTQDQEVVCSLNAAQMTTVLRLTPDCPLMDGSVYMDQLVGLGGWDAAVVNRIQETVNATKYRSPVAIVHALTDEILRLQDEEGMQLPLTPKMPVRGGGHAW